MVVLKKHSFKFLAFVLVALVFLSTFSVLSFTEVFAKSLLGDVTLDGELTVTDIVTLRSYIMGDMNFDDAQLALADVNGDKNISVTDIVTLRSYIMDGTIIEVPDEPDPDVEIPDNEVPDRTGLYAAGTTLLDLVTDSFAVDDEIGNVVRAQIGSDDKAELWQYISYVDALSVKFSANKTNSEHKAQYIKALEGLQNYNSGRTDFTSFANMYGGEGNVYYNDNSWIVIVYYRAYQLLEDPVYLEKSKEIAEYCYSGWDEILDGGIYWSETTKITKNTCSNAPMAMASADLYNLTSDEYYLNWAKKIYSWTKEKLMDEDGLYFDSIDMSGNVDESKYTYNSGCMLSASVELYNITNNETYLNDAKKTAKSADDFFFMFNRGVYILNNATPDPWFHSWLNEGYLRLYDVDSTAEEYLKHIYSAAMNGYETKNENGFVFSGWQENRGSDNDLVHQSGTIKILVNLSQFDIKTEILNNMPDIEGDFISGKEYILTALCSDKELSVADNSSDNEANVMQFEYGWNEFQHWRFDYVGDGYYSLINVGSGKALTVSEEKNESDVNVNQQDYIDISAQKWFFEYNESANCYRVSALCGPDMSLDVSGSSKDDGANVQQWKSNTSEAQQWIVTPVDMIGPEPEPEPEPEPIPFSVEAADISFNSFVKEFYSASDGAGGVQGNYWDRAEMFEMFLDTYERTRSDEHRKLVDEYYNGFVKSHGDDWTWNDYNDDIMWMVIACSRAYNLTGDDKYKNQAKFHFDAVYERAYDDELGGGLYWRREKPNDADKLTKNSCINGPAVISACMLAEIFDDSSYYEKAIDLYDWQCEVLFEEKTGRVYDAKNIHGEVSRWASTYNQGTFIGASVLLYKHYGDQKYLDNAVKAAEYTRDKMYPDGIITGEDGGNDLPGFKGIFTRWMKILMIDAGQTQFIPWMQLNAEAAWENRNSKNIMWTKWAEKTPEKNPNAWNCSAAVALLQNFPYSLMKTDNK